MKYVTTGEYKRALGGITGEGANQALVTSISFIRGKKETLT